MTEPLTPATVAQLAELLSRYQAAIGRRPATPATVGRTRRDLEGALVRHAAALIEAARDAVRPSLGDEIEALVADVPESEWDKIPADFAASVEKYR